MPEIIKENRYLILVLLLIFCIYQYGIQKICGFTLYPDEFGYWASAANALDYDWSEVASMGSYYSFGYSLILIPVLRLFSDGVMAYRAAITVNMLLVCASIPMLCGIAQKIFSKTDMVQRAFISGIAAFYPPWIFYMQMTMAEALLGFLFVLLVYLILCFIEKPTTITAALLAVSLVYIYCVHMRALGVVLASLITLFLFLITDRSKGKPIAVFLIVLILMGGAAFILKSHTIAEVFSHAEREVLTGNDYGGQADKLKQLWRPEEIWLLFKEIIGRIYYLGIASFGIFYWALIWCIKESAALIKKLFCKDNISLKQWGALFLLLSIAGEVMISSIYMHHPGTVDCLIYGRYSDLFVPVALLAGVLVMWKSRLLLRITLLAGALSGGMALMLANEAERLGLEGIRGYHIAGISYLTDKKNQDIVVFFKDTWVKGFLLMIAVSVFIRLSGKWRGSSWLLTGVLLIEILAGLQLGNNYTYPVNNVNFENRIIVDAVNEYYKEDDEIVYLDEGFPEFVDFLQMQLPDRPIQVMEGDDFVVKDRAEISRFLITYSETKSDEQLRELYKKKVMANTFCLYYNP